ncbi:MAG: sulfite exporter TauE/SafE family protein [Devosia sp.]
MTELLLLVAGLIAGALNTLAGGGSFVAFPALLAAGVPPVIANASNTYAALPGYVSGAVGFWSDIKKHRSRLLPYTVVSLLFGYVGAELLLHISNEAFNRIVPWLMLFSVLLFAFGNQINRAVAARAGNGRGAKLTGAVLLFVLLAALCVYGGFFNAGLGILLLAFLALAGMTDIHAMNGLKLWISSIVAAIAVIRFAISGSIDWYHGSITLAGVVVGAYVAARLAHRVPTPVLRALVLVYASALTLWFFYAAYFAG